MTGVFRVTATDPSCGARAGVLRTIHGEVETPVFMPVATQGSVKALTSCDLKDLGIGALLANSYHLDLRPGPEVIEEAGGLNRFMDFPGMILTDSGGFQVFSLADLRTIDDHRIVFQSHLDGSRRELTPESVIRLQSRLGSDCWTSLDECPAYPCTEAEALRALERTERWTEASEKAFHETDRDGGHLFFPILQGSVYAGLRKRAAEHIRGVRSHGVALGGFCVGEEKARTWEALSATVPHLPPERPRYLMGMGAPADLWDAVERGVDMMDCVWPTRIARNGVVMTPAGRLNIKNKPFQKDFGPIDPDCDCPACARYSRAYLCHLFRAKELAAFRLLTLHNLHFTMSLMRRIRKSIEAGNFIEERKKFFERYLGK